MRRALLIAAGIALLAAIVWIAYSAFSPKGPSSEVPHAEMFSRQAVGDLQAFGQGKYQAQYDQLASSDKSQVGPQDWVARCEEVFQTAGKPTQAEVIEVRYLDTGRRIVAVDLSIRWSKLPNKSNSTVYYLDESGVLKQTMLWGRTVNVHASSVQTLGGHTASNDSSLLQQSKSPSEPTSTGQAAAPSANTPNASGGSAYHTPVRGSAERQALMDAARRYRHTSAQFVVHELYAQGDWAFGEITPEGSPHSAISDVYIWQRTNGNWTCLLGGNGDTGDTQTPEEDIRRALRQSWGLPASLVAALQFR